MNSKVRQIVFPTLAALIWGTAFVAQSIDKPDILEIVSRKASAMLGQPVRTFVVDLTAQPAVNPRMEQLMKFGREHSDIIKIKNN